MNVLVTGAKGQLANEIKVLSAHSPSFQFFFTTKEQLPIEDKKALALFFNQNKIDACINCAAYTAVDKAESEPQKAFLINADAVGNLAMITKERNAKLIHISTDYVYDGNEKSPLKEDDKTAPVNVYGESKLEGEKLALVENPDCIIIRTSWVYSSFGNNFVKTMLRLFAEREEINVVEDQIGSPTYAADLAEVILQFLQPTNRDSRGIFNYSNAGVTSWFEFAMAIKEFTGSNCRINPVATSAYKTAAQRPLYSVMDTGKIKNQLGVSIPFWKDSLKKCLEVLSKQ